MFMHNSLLWINCSLNNHYTKDNIDTIIQHLNQLWVSQIRWEFDFFNINKHNIYVEKYAIQEFHKNNITIVWVLSGIVPGTLKNITMPEYTYQAVSKNIENFKIFVSNKVKKYKKEIYHRQIWNEANTKRFRITKPNPKEYVNLVKECFYIIKKEQNSAIIICWWIFYDPSQWFLPNYNKNFLKECITLWINEFIDIYTVHPYSLSCYIWYKKPIKIIKETLSNINTWISDSWISNKQVWVTEFWISSICTLYTAREKTLIYIKLYKQLREKNIPFFIRNICDFYNKRYWRLNPERWFWILTKDYCIKKEFINLKQELMY